MDRLADDFYRSCEILESRAAFREALHPRDKDGKFAAGGRGGGIGRGKRDKPLPGGFIGSGSNFGGNLGMGLGAGWGSRKGGDIARRMAERNGISPTGSMMVGIVGSMAGSRIASGVGHSVGERIGNKLGMREQSVGKGTLTQAAGFIPGIMGVHNTKRAAHEIGSFVRRRANARRRPGFKPRPRTGSAAELERILARLRKSRGK